MGPDAIPFVLLTGSKGHFIPGCGTFCPFDRFKRTFRARMELLIRQFHRVRTSFGLMFPIDPPAPRGHLFIPRFYLPNSVYLFTPDLPKNLAFCML
ncbi:hypothetical protein P421_06980 [Heyndrickxia coagulans P38]|nr:hypothetical protein P421_06980 [Heyndrickxia coagulans P38]